MVEIYRMAGMEGDELRLECGRNYCLRLIKNCNRIDFKFEDF